MPAPDYYAIELELKALLESDETLQGVAFAVEEEVMFGMDMTPWIGLYMVDRISAQNQFLAANQKQVYHLQWSIWVFVFNIELAPAIQECSRVTGLLEIALMNNSTISNMVEFSYLEGGTLPTRVPNGNGMPDAGVVICAEVRLTSELIISTT